MKWAKLLGGHVATKFPEHLLDMRLSAEDTKEATLLELDPERAFAAEKILSELIDVGLGRWTFVSPPPPELPKPPPK